MIEQVSLNKMTPKELIGFLGDIWNRTRHMNHCQLARLTEPPLFWHNRIKGSPPTPEDCGKKGANSLSVVPCGWASRISISCQDRSGTFWSWPGNTSSQSGKGKALPFLFVEASISECYSAAFRRCVTSQGRLKRDSSAAGHPISTVICAVELFGSFGGGRISIKIKVLER